MNAASPSAEPVRIFIGYHQKDSHHLERLKVHLSSYHIRDENIELWDDQKILAGGRWLEQLQSALQRADAAILLVSADFLGSRFIHEHEILPLLQRADEQGIKIIPVIVSSCAFNEHALARFKPAHNPAKPIVEVLGGRREKVWAAIAREIYQVIQHTRRQRQEQSAPQALPQSAPTPPRPAPLSSAGYMSPATQPSLWESIPALPSASPERPFPHTDPEKAAARPEPRPTREETAPLSLPFQERYRECLLKDRSLTHLQVLDMDRPLPMQEVYIKVRLYSRPRFSGMLERRFEQAQDPLLLLRQRQEWLSQRQRAGTALEPLEALKAQRLSVIVGDPGAGKTTLLRHLAIQVAQCQAPDFPTVPVYIELHKVAGQSELDLFETAVQCLQHYGFERAEGEAFLKERMAAGEVVFLLDALDEAAVGESVEEAEAAYQRVADAVTRLAKRYHQGPIVVTARRAGYFQRGLLPGFTVCEILDFLPADIDRFIERWFEHSDHERRLVLAAKLQADIRKYPRIAALAANPLLLSLLVMTYEDDAQPELDNRADLYQQCVTMLLTRWDNKRHRPRARLLSASRHQRLLQAIAWRFHCLRQRTFSRKDLLPIVSEFCASLSLTESQVEHVLREITGERGLLRELAMEVYSFLHLTLQEFFVAEYVRDDIEALLPHAGDPWWEEVIVLFAGQVRDAGPFFARLLARDDPDDIFSSKLLLAGRCLAAQPVFETRQQYREETTRRLLALLSQTPYALTRQQAAETLAEIERSRLQSAELQHLLRLVNDKQYPEEWRDCVMQALVVFGSEEITHHFLHLFLQREGTMYGELWFQDNLREMISKFGTKEMARYILQVVLDERRADWLRGYLLYLLGLIGEPEVAPAVFSLLLHSLDNEVLLTNALFCLGRLNYREALSTFLLKLNEPHLNIFAFEHCLMALREFKDHTVVPALWTLLSRKDLHEVKRCSIARMLAELDNETQVESIIARLRQSELEESIRCMLAEMVVRRSHRLLQPVLPALLTEEAIAEPVRRALAWYYGLRCDASQLRELRELCALPQLPQSVYDALTIARALLDDVTVRADMQRLLVEGSIAREWSDEAAEGMVRVLDDAAVMEQLNKMGLGAEWRIALLQAIARLGRTALVPALCALLANRIVIQEVRRAALEAIGQLATDVETVELLVRLLPDSDLRDELYQALWLVCRRAGVTVVADGPGALALRVIAR